MLWEFSWLLHYVPHQVSSHLNDVRELAVQMARDKAQGQAAQANDWAKKKNWDADVRAEVLVQALRVMVEMSDRHGVRCSDVTADGIEELAGGDIGRKRKRDLCGEETQLRRIEAPTPPSSRGSPTFSHLRSTDGSASSSGDEEGPRDH